MRVERFILKISKDLLKFISNRTKLNPEEISSVEYSYKGYLINNSILVEHKLKVKIQCYIIGYYNNLTNDIELDSILDKFIESHMIFKVKRSPKYYKVKVYKHKKFIRRLLTDKVSDYSLINLSKKIKLDSISFSMYELLLDQVMNRTNKYAK